MKEPKVSVIVPVYNAEEYIKCCVDSILSQPYQNLDINVEFEKHRYMSIRDYDSYLRKHYWNYMQLPPKEKQVTHHQFAAYWKEER